MSEAAVVAAGSSAARRVLAALLVCAAGAAFAAATPAAPQAMPLSMKIPATPGPVAPSARSTPRSRIFACTIIM